MHILQCGVTCKKLFSHNKQTNPQSKKKKAIPLILSQYPLFLNNALFNFSNILINIILK